MNLNLRKLVVVLLLAFSLGCYGGRHQKHTQQCRLAYISPEGHVYWFMRPNNEVFAMNFDNPPALRPGVKLKDITYYDDNGYLVHFVKAQIDNGK